MKRHCPYCRSVTIGIGALLLADDNKPLRCINCGACILPRGVGAWAVAIRGWLPRANVEGLLVILPMVVVTLYIDIDRSLGAQIAALIANILLINLVRLVAPLDVVASPVWGSRKPAYSKVAPAWAMFAMVLWTAFIVLVALLGEPAITVLL